MYVSTGQPIIRNALFFFFFASGKVSAVWLRWNRSQFVFVSLELEHGCSFQDFPGENICMRTAHGSSSWICQAEYTGTSHAVRAHFDDFGVHLALQTLSGALAGICPYCSYVPMETRTRISCVLQCWRGKSKHGWEGRNQRGRGQRVPSLGTISGVLKLPGSGREGRRQFQ